MDNEKQAVLDYFAKLKGKKSKLYFNDILKAVPGAKPRTFKKVINEMIQEGLLTYWSSGSTTLYMLKSDENLAAEEAAMSDEGKE
ncbi:MAG TPA: dissimilatory sulfite reductase D family protein [Syntrophales bacterium]|nr:dissimilatory sulfite reductase D family protein [Syntrophales bacterium]HPQ44892.1 dissimilatory sulfite reductase D family protein [Syntrophales bacterium]